MGGMSSSARILVLGLDNSGKTTVMKHVVAADQSYKPQSPDFDSCLYMEHFAQPTLGYQQVEVRLSVGPTLCLVEVGGSPTFRDFWRYHVKFSEGILFVVDSNDPERLAEAKDFLHGVVTCWELYGIPVVILANKQDLPFALPTWEVAEHLRTNVLEKLGHPCHVHKTIGLTGDGLVTALHVLIKFILQKRKASQ